MLDTAVFDIRTRKLLLRAPGYDHASQQSTAIASESGQKRISDASFESAVAKMSENLETEIDKFGERVKADKSVQIAYSRDYSGSSAPLFLLCTLALVALFAPRGTRRRNRAV